MRSQQVVEELGISYRRLHHLTRTDGPLSDLAVGSGRRVAWDRDLVTRLKVAVALTNAVPSCTTATVLPEVARRVLAVSAEPPADGWAILNEGDVQYAESLPELAERLRCSPAAVVARVSPVGAEG